MKNKVKYLLALTLATSASVSLAAPIPIDLSTWESDGPGNWAVQGVGNDSVFQSLNSAPSVFFESGANAQNTIISGNITVETSSDDDFIGFVLGYQDGEMQNSTSEFMLIDWKKRNQSPATVGMAISLVKDATLEDDFWTHSGGITEVARANNLAATGWVTNQTYTFDIKFTDNLIEVMVDSILELSITAADAGLTSFSNGAAGFYNYSQASVRYAGIGETTITTPPTAVSAPGMLVLTLIGGFLTLRLRKA